MATADGAQIGNFHVSLAQDPWQIRTGFDVKTKAAKPWDLTFPNPQDINNTNTSESKENQISPKLLNLQSDQNKSKERVAILERQLQTTKVQLSQARSSLQNAVNDTQQIRGKLDNEYSEQIKQVAFDRDVALGKVRNLENLLDAYTARFNKNVSTTSTTPRATVNSTSPQSTDPPQHDTPLPSDDLMADVRDFNAKWYRKDVEHRILGSIHPLTLAGTLISAKAEVFFDILPDGSPDRLKVTVIEPKSSDIELMQEIQQRVQHIILATAPFHPVSQSSISLVSMKVELQQVPQNDQVAYSVVAQFAEKPNVVSSLR
jgi:hypothetical protein